MARKKDTDVGKKLILLWNSLNFSLQVNSTVL